MIFSEALAASALLVGAPVVDAAPAITPFVAEYTFEQPVAVLPKVLRIANGEIFWIDES